ncbi:hypothetical protein [Absidia glauca]|uniref:Uncharacterized protein n=1 Tax=Absidia glauca TaxID=4829 RepID=A0A168SNT2_ABSGL|nr:hypothetical protein [Absidia glauca]
MSPYAATRRQLQHIKMAAALCEMINKDWCAYLNFPFASAKLLPGSILFNTENGQAVLVSTVEMFGRTNNADIYREGFGKLKGAVQTTSLPPTTIKTMYPSVWPVSLQRSDGQKPVIGTEVSNALVTSCLRIDSKETPVVGSMSSGFNFSTINTSLSIKIFLDRESIDRCLEMAEVLITSTNTRINILMLEH